MNLAEEKPVFAIRSVNSFPRRKSLNELDLSRMSHQMQEIILRATSSKTNVHQDAMDQRLVELQKASEAQKNQQKRASISSQGRSKAPNLGIVPEADKESRMSSLTDINTNAAPVRSKSAQEKRKSSIQGASAEKPIKNADKSLGKNETVPSAKKTKTEDIQKYDVNVKNNTESKTKLAENKPPDIAYGSKTKASSSGAPNVHSKMAASESKQAAPIVNDKIDTKAAATKTQKSHKPVETIQIEPEVKERSKQNEKSSGRVTSTTQQWSSNQLKEPIPSSTQQETGSKNVRACSPMGSKTNKNSHRNKNNNNTQIQQVQAEESSSSTISQNNTPRENERLLMASVKDSTPRYLTFSQSDRRHHNHNHPPPKLLEQALIETQNEKGDSDSNPTTSEDERQTSGSTLDEILQQARSALLEIGRLKSGQDRFLNVKIDLNGLRDVNVV
ncbi:uncharacterized protein LOC142342635 isoform X2 [Convolutriloba macropyga]